MLNLIKLDLLLVLTLDYLFIALLILDKIFKF